jgi:hypothetical protein
MIQFKGAYFYRSAKASKSVLVQFDGVLLHIWQMTDPFCRLLTSDVFTLQPSIGRGKRCIKLPNGGKIETEDITAFSMLRTRQRSLCSYQSGLGSQRQLIWLVVAAAALGGGLALLHAIGCFK